MNWKCERKDLVKLTKLLQILRGEIKRRPCSFPFPTPDDASLSVGSEASKTPTLQVYNAHPRKCPGTKWLEQDSGI